MAVEDVLDPYDTAFNLNQKPSGDRKSALRRQSSGRKSDRSSFSAIVDDRGWSLLHIAAKGGNLDEVLRIIHSRMFMFM